MSPNRDLEDGHHKPRDHKNKKRRRFEDQEGRAKRIGFKNYLRELEEQDLDGELDELDSDGT